MAGLPGGKVAFLLTDVEGSTRQWEAQPDHMRQILAEHDRLLASEIHRHAGMVVKSKGEGDSFFAVFENPISAVQAACSIQLAVNRMSAGERLKVRMAIHTGTAQLREGDYFGPDVNRAARLRSAAHGGQVLLSRATRDEIVGSNETQASLNGITLRALGEHRLKDISHPEQVFQLVHPDLPHDFPPLRTVEHTPHNLPHQLNRFVGRRNQRAELERLISEKRLVTLVGAGGVGKTRLAIQVARDSLGEFPDGAWVVELAPLTDPELLPRRTAAALNVPEEGGRAILDTLIDQIRTSNLLLVLDNCEHLIKACADLVESLLHACPHVRILATSREALGIPGELSWRVPSLSVPERTSLDLGELTRCEAVDLFKERVPAPPFELDEKTAPLIVQICRRLDGIPLAIELAAAKLRVLSLAQLADRLDDRFGLLTGGRRTALPRQQTLRATIDWSYGLLTPEEQTLMRQLSVFAGGMTLEAVESVCAGDPGSKEAVLEVVTGLVNKSILNPDETADRMRYRMLETIRQYARDKLLESGEAGRIRYRHRDHFLAMAETSSPEMIGPKQPAWIKSLTADLDNLRTAYEWSMERREPEKALRLAVNVQFFFEVIGHWLEGRERVERALAAAPDIDDRLRARALRVSGHFAAISGDFEEGGDRSERALELYRDLGHALGKARTLLTLGFIAANRDQVKESRIYYSQAAELFSQEDDKHGRAEAAFRLSELASFTGDLTEAEKQYGEAARLFEECGDRRWVAMARAALALAIGAQGRWKEAKPLFSEVVAEATEINDRANMIWAGSQMANAALFGGERDLALSLMRRYLKQAIDEGYRLAVLSIRGDLAFILEVHGEYGEAERLYRQQLAEGLEKGNASVIEWSVRGLASMSLAQGDYERAAVLYGCDAELREGPFWSDADFVRDWLNRRLDALRSNLPAEACESAWQRGYAMTPVVVAAFAGLLRTPVHS